MVTDVYAYYGCCMKFLLFSLYVCTYVRVYVMYYVRTYVCAPLYC